MLNHYTFLGVKENATQDEIKRAFRKLALKHHPDKTKAPESVEIFKKLVEVNDVLTNPQKKKEYDLSLTQLMAVGPQFRRGPPPARHPPPPQGYTQTQTHQTGYTRGQGPYSYSSYFQSFSNRHGGGSFPPPPPPPPSASRDGVPRASSNAKTYSHDDDDFDFAYKRNQTHYDSFSHNKSYFTSSRTSYNPSNGSTTGYFRSGATFNKAGMGSNNNQNNKQHQNKKNGRTKNHTTSRTQYSTEGNIPPHNVRIPNTSGTQQRFTSYVPLSPQPTYVPPHSNSHPPTSANSNFKYTQASTSTPSMPSDPLPNSWQKQQTNFKNNNIPLSSSAGNVRHSTPSQNQNTPSSNQNQPSDIPVYPTDMKTPPTKDNPGPKSRTTSIGDLFGNMANSLKFDLNNIDISTKSTPRNIRTQNKYVNKNERSGLPTHSRSSSASNTPKFQTASGRTPRTSLEESNRFEYKFEEKDQNSDQDEFNDENNEDHEDSEDELVEIDESTFRSNGAPDVKRQKTKSASTSSTSPPPPPRHQSSGISSMNFDDLKRTTPLTQTNGNFEMKGFSRALDESEDLNHGKTLKKPKISTVPSLESEMLAIEEFQLSNIPEPSGIVKDFDDWQRYRHEFDEFQTWAIKEKSKLIKYLEERIKKDNDYTNVIFKSGFNMDIYDNGLQKDNEITVRLWELNQAIIRVMRQYRELKPRFPKQQA